MTAVPRRRTASALLIVLALIAAVLTGCSTAPLDIPSSSSPAAATGPVTAHLPSADPQPIDDPRPAGPGAERIVAFDRYGTYGTTVFALGLGKNLVGRDIATKFSAAADIPVVNPDGNSINIESVIALKPSVVLTDSSIASAVSQADQLRDAGIRVVMLKPERSVATNSALLQSVANALGVPDSGTTLVDRTEREIAQARTEASAANRDVRIAFLYARGTGLLILGGRGSGADSLIELLGAQDAGVAAGITDPFISLTSEGLVKARPDVLLMMTDGLKSVGGIDGLLKVPGVAQTPAGKNRRVVDMDDGTLLSFGPRTGQVALALVRALNAR